MTDSPIRPLVLLDVDGVLHDSHARDRIRLADAPESVAASLGVELVMSHGRRLAVPTWMPSLISGLGEVAELWWCTTWMERANDDLGPHLGIGVLPVIGSGTRGIGLAWKADMARPVTETALAEGREVVWIEDFDGADPGIGGVELVDTADLGYLTGSHLPQWLTAELPNDVRN